MIAITGAAGKLGRKVIEGLLNKVPATEIVALVRSPGKAADLANLGVQLRSADYSKPETLGAAFAGVDKVLLISSSEVGQRVPQHQAVVLAAKAAGAKLLAYTSILRANTCTLILSVEHQATEEYIQESGVPFVLMRNGWYLENHTEALPLAVQHGAILGAAGDGQFASATRSDYADAAVKVLTSSGHEGKIYELVGNNPYTLSQLAAEVSKQVGKKIAYKNLPGKDYEAALMGFGLPVPLAAALSDADLGAEKGELNGSSGDLSSLIGRPTTTLAAAVAAAF